MNEKKKVCMVCGKPSESSICDACKAQIQGEAAHKKEKIEREVKVDPELLKRKRRED